MKTKKGTTSVKFSSSSTSFDDNSSLWKNCRLYS